MNAISGFIINHYGWFIIISVMLILALIGYFVEQKKAKANPYKIEKKEEINLDALNNNQNESLQNMINKNKDINNLSNRNEPESL